MSLFGFHAYGWRVQAMPCSREIDHFAASEIVGERSTGAALAGQPQSLGMFDQQIGTAGHLPPRAAHWRAYRRPAAAALTLVAPAIGDVADTLADFRPLLFERFADFWLMWLSSNLSSCSPMAPLLFDSASW